MQPRKRSWPAPISGAPAIEVMPDIHDTLDPARGAPPSTSDDRTGAPVLEDVASSAEEPADPLAGGLTVTISEDRLEATLVLPPLRNARAPEPGALVERLRGEHRLVDVDVDEVERMLEEALDTESESTSAVVARGQPPVDGCDGTLEWLGNFFESRVLRLPDGSVDHYHHTKVSVYEGQPILKIHPPTRGTAGTDVIGQKIAPTPGAPAPLECDDAVRRDERNADLVCAARAGMVEYSHEKLTVSELQVIEQVDFASGSIDFEGAVQVRGTVMPKFSVIGTGPVIISGTVENAHIESRTNITIEKGVMGRGDARLISPGDISVGFAREATIECGGRFDARRELLWCEGRVTGDLLIETGRIIGGRWLVGGSVIADEIGSREEVTTFLTLGQSPELHRELRTLTRARKKYHEQLVDLRQRYGPLLAGRVGLLDAKEREVIEQRMFLYERRANRSRKREFILRKRLHQQRQASFVWVKTKIFAGTRLRLNGGQHLHQFAKDQPGPVCVRYDARNRTAVIEHVKLEDASTGCR